MNNKINIPLNIPNIIVLNQSEGENGEIILEIESTEKGGTCFKCGCYTEIYHDTNDEITIQHLPILERPVFLKIRPKRFRCPNCSKGKKIKAFTQRLDWYNPKSRVTKDFENYFLTHVIASTLHDARIKAKISYDTGRSILKRAISTDISWEKLKNIQVLGLDEISLKKGHKQYVTIVSVKNKKGEVDVLTVLPDRKKETVEAFLEKIPPTIKKQIQEVACDMYDGFIGAVESQLPNAKIVIDRFHVAKNYSKGFETLRKSEMKKIKKSVSEDEYKDFKGTMWALRKNPDTLSDKDKKLLDSLFRHSQSLKDAYDLKNKLKTYLDMNISKSKGRIKLNRWIKMVRQKGITCFDSFIKTFKNYEDYILNYFENRTNSGFVEGLNNKIKVIKRRCFGITDIESLFRRIWLDLNGYSKMSGNYA